MIEIVATTGEIVQVDRVDYDDWLKDYIVKVDKNGYVYGRHVKHGGGRGAGTLHRLIMNPPKGRLTHVDHINGNKLDNRRQNLRICSHAENMRNRHGDKGVSKHRGVVWFKNTKHWKVQIKSEGKTIRIGEFTNEVAAANAYNHWANKEHGEFASLNDVPFMEESEWIKYRCGKNKTSKYHGVSFDNTHKKWLTQCWDGTNKKNYSCRCNSEVEAALKYNEFATKYHGDKAKLNTIPS
ncbi:HNH endonuclease [Paenibacillus sp. QZ-Y1]|uniref:HNH endonuclease n=1 Tax=Paenibacillus sp. QZ-Y1 TaxID=3414511 RepID=UPI003F79B90B